MPTLGDVVAVPSKELVLERLLGQLAGRGWTKQVGKGAGTVWASSGAPTNDYDVVVKVSNAGQLGNAQVRYSFDGGATFGAATAVPANGSYALPGSGVTLTFANGSGGQSPSFIVGDTYSFALRRSIFPVTAWQPLSVPRSLLENDAEALADLYQLVSNVAAGGLVQVAAELGLSEWVDLHAGNFYGLTRRAGTTAKGLVTLYDLNSQGPFVKGAGEVVVQTAFGLRFINQSGFTLPLGGSVQIAVTAEAVGSEYNVGNDTITQLVTSMPGVSVDNPDPGSGTWLTSSGSDEEGDAELALRCVNRWPQLGIGVPTGNYDTWAKEATPNVTKTTARVSATPGVVDLVVAGPAGPVAPGDVTAVSEYVQPRAPLCVSVNVMNAVVNPVSFSGTVYAPANLLAQAQAEVEANLAALIAAAPLGGTIYRAQMIEEIMRATGVVNVTLTSPAADVTLVSDEVATYSSTLAYSGV